MPTERSSLVFGGDSLANRFINSAAMAYSLWYNTGRIWKKRQGEVFLMLSCDGAIDPSKVAIYIRWSTEDQGEGTTLNVQRDACKSYLLSQGWLVNEDLVYIDDGYSGGNLNRPALSMLRKAVASGFVDCVVVYKLDRLSRSVADTVTLVIKEWEGKCSLKSARESIDTTSHAGRMFFYTLVNYAEWERSVIKERTHSGKLRRAQEGKNPGYTPPYGYRCGENGTYVMVQKESVTVRRIYDLYLHGMGVRVIANRLNHEGSKSPSSRVWSQTTILKILSNPAYTGRLVYGRRRRTSNGRVNKEPLVITENVFPQIIAKETWDMVQAVKHERPGFRRGQGSGRATTSGNLLGGLLKCAGCGHSFKGTGITVKHKYRYYRCLGLDSKGGAFCTCAGIRQDVLDEHVVGLLRSLYGGRQARETLSRQMTIKWEQQRSEAQMTLQALQKEMNRIEAGEQRLKRLLMDGDLTVAEYRELRANMERDTEEVRQTQQRAETLERQALAGLHDQGRILEALSKLDEWEVLDLQSQKLLLRQFIHQIRVFKDLDLHSITCQIEWKWDSELIPMPSLPASSIAMQYGRSKRQRHQAHQSV